jgi:hypothetical protein
LAVFCAIGFAHAQEPRALAPEVRAFVKEDAPVLALTHVRVIDGTGGAARADQTLVIRAGKISTIGDTATAKIPEGAKVLDLTGYSVIPGLIGMHDHMYYPAPLGSLPMYPEHASSFPALYLAGGITTIRTTGSIEPYTDLELKCRKAGRTKNKCHRALSRGPGLFHAADARIEGRRGCAANGRVLGRAGSDLFQGVHAHYPR